MKHGADVLEALGVPFEVRIVSAHRTPQRLYDFASGARERGLKVVIAGAGGAAHLPGMALCIGVSFAFAVVLFLMASVIARKTTAADLQ